jgi:hypothetical protein
MGTFYHNDAGMTKRNISSLLEQCCRSHYRYNYKQFYHVFDEGVPCGEFLLRADIRSTEAIDPAWLIYELSPPLGEALSLLIVGLVHHLCCDLHCQAWSPSFLILFSAWLQRGLLLRA